MKRKSRDVITERASKSMAGAIAASWALPSDFNPYRMRNEYSTEETALFKVFEEHPVAVGATAGANPQLRTDQHLEFIFQDVLRNRVTYVRNPTNDTWSYQWCFGRTGITDNTTYPMQINTDEFLVPSHAKNLAAIFKPHGDTLFAVNDKGITGMWFDQNPAGTQSTITIGLSTSPSAAGRIILLQWQDGVWKEVASASIVAATTSYTITPPGTSGYFALKLRNLSEAQNITVVQTGVSECWGHYPAPYIVTNGASIESVRHLGHSMLVKNVTASQNKQGAIVGVQPGKSRPWMSFIGVAGTEDAFSVVRDYAGAPNSKPLETGGYLFVKPTEENDLKLRESFVVSNGKGISTSVYWSFAQTPLLGTEYCVVAAQCNTSTPQNLLVRTDAHGEFETSNQFFSVDKPRAEPNDWRDGMEGLASMQQFYENPTHWKRILSTIGSVASVGGRILSLFGPKGMAVGMPLGMAGDIIKGGFQ